MWFGVLAWDGMGRSNVQTWGWLILMMILMLMLMRLVNDVPGHL